MNGAHEEPQITPDLREPPASGALTWGEPGELRCRKTLEKPIGVNRCPFVHIRPSVFWASYDSCQCRNFRISVITIMNFISWTDSYFHDFCRFLLRGVVVVITIYFYNSVDHAEMDYR